MRALVPTAMWVAIVLPGCSPPSQQATNDLTSGQIAATCSPEARPTVERCRVAFQVLYPQARIELRSGTSRDAIAALFGARADLAVITRDLLPEERRAAVDGKLEIEGYRFARDAAVLLVHPENPLTNVTVDDVRRLYRGEIRSWSELGGANVPIEPVVPPVGSDLMEFFLEDVMAGEPIRARSITAASDEEAVRIAGRRRGAIAIVTLGAVGPGAKALRLAALRGLPYYAPDPETVHDGRYPVTRFYNVYARTHGPALANGFITYVTSMDGQRWVHQSGLVPTTVPVRFVRRSSMLATHKQGDSIRTP